MARSGQITVPTAGTAVQGPNEPGIQFTLAAHPANTGIIWIGNNGSNTVSNATGYGLKPGDPPLIVKAANLNEFWIDATVNGEKACWIKTR